MTTKNIICIYLIIIVGFASILNSGCHKSENDSDDITTTNVYTTLNRTIVPELVTSGQTAKIDDPANFANYGYGKWHYGSGLPFEQRLDLMPSGYVNTSVTKAANLLRFFTITDIHITDKESPAQAIFFRKYLSNNAISVYSPLMLYTPHVFDATIKTINGLNKQNKIDFGLALGDLINNSQYNELRWFIDILDGKMINPDSGADDDPIKGSNNDYQDPFQATGLDRSIPWYAIMGNHDHFWIGSKPMNDRIRESLVGSNILQFGNILKDPNWMNQNTFSGGTLDGSTLYGNLIGEGVVADMGTIPSVPSDPNRKAISKTDFINELSNTSSLPIGHGFKQSNPQNIFGTCYSFEPKTDLPIKVIVLDDTQEDTDVSNIYGHGSLKNGRREWLISQLQAGQNEGKLMIIAAHIPIGVAFGQEVGWYDETYERNLIAELKTYPNLILWVSGHRHLNTVTAFKSDDLNHPENGFWEVETKSLREFPQQFRTFDIVRNSDNTISIFTTNIDPEVIPGSYADISRSYAIASNQIYGLIEPQAGTGPVSYNAELVKQLSPEMQLKIKNYGIVNSFQ